jgi:hypothetical protein
MKVAKAGQLIRKSGVRLGERGAPVQGEGGVSLRGFVPEPREGSPVDREPH